MEQSKAQAREVGGMSRSSLRGAKRRGNPLRRRSGSIRQILDLTLDCFASLAMTVQVNQTTDH
jgi:hypothetical protein